MARLAIRERRIEEVSILDLEGKLRLGEENLDFHNAIRQLLEKGRRHILINLENVTFIDSSGLGTLVSGFYAVRKKGGTVKLLNLNKRVYELMFMTRLLTVFDVYEDEQEALNNFQAFIKERGNPQSVTVEKGLL